MAPAAETVGRHFRAVLVFLTRWSWLINADAVLTDLFIRALVEAQGVGGVFDAATAIAD